MGMGMVVSLDRDMEADIKTDITAWDYLRCEPGYFDVVWTSPPCTECRRPKTVGVRKIEEANKIAQWTLDILHYMRPHY